MKLTFFILILFLLTNCGYNKNWNEFYPIGLPKTNNSYQCLEIVNENQIYLGGRRTESIRKSDNHFDFNNYCELYHSSDLGRTWTKMNLGELNGEVYFVRKSHDNIVVLNQSVTEDTTTVIKSIDNGKTWISLLDLPDRYYISDMFLRQDGAIELNARINKNNQREIFRISDQNIDTIRFGPKIRHLHFSENGYYAIETSDDTLSSLITFDLNGNEISRKSIELEKSFSYSKRNPDNDILWYKTYSRSDIIIYRNEEFIEISLSSFEDYNIVEPFVEDSLVLINGYYEDDVAFLGIIHTFLMSKDLGKTWSEEKIPSSMSTGPSALKNGTFLSYSVMGKLKERK